MTNIYNGNEANASKFITVPSPAMAGQSRQRRRFLVGLGLPTLFALAAACALLLWESRRELGALEIKNLFASAPQAEPVLPQEPAAAPAGGTERPLEQEASTGAGHTDLLAAPEFIEVATVQGERYVSLTDASGLWMVSNPDRLFRTGPGAWRPGRGLEFEEEPIPPDKPRGLPFAGMTMQLSLHERLVRNRCVYVDVVANAPVSLRVWSKGTKQTVTIGAGGELVDAGCVKGDLARDELHVSLKPLQPVAANARPTVRGAWIVPEGMPPPAEPPARPEACGSGGLLVSPGQSLLLRTMAGKGDVLHLEHSGDSAPDLSLSVHSNPGGTRALLEPGQTTSGAASWPLELPRRLPVELTASLPEQATSPACISRLSVEHAPAPPPVLGSRPPRVDGVVFILLDTLRADAAQAFNPRSTVETPVLGGLAKRSLVFRDATSHANYTKPSVASILTGLYPHAHGALSHKGILSPDVPMVTEMLERAGIDTLGLFSNRFLTEKFGFMRGWDEDVHVNAYRACVSGEIVSGAAQEMFGQWQPEGPFFIYIHLMDPHAPYDPPLSMEVKYVGHRVLDGRFTPKSSSRFITDLRRGKVDPPDEDELKILKGLYRGDVAAMDAVLGEILELLDGQGVLDRALLIVTSDHGEEFMEHGWLGHGTNIHPELTHIPLLMSYPDGSQAASVGGLVGHLDLAPTILDALGQPIPPHLPGRSLLDQLTGPGDPAAPPVYLLEHWNGTNGMRLGEWLVIAHRKSTTIARLNGQKVWYHDPGRNRVKWLYLRERLALLILSNRETGEVQTEVWMDEQTKAQLEALGYILEGQDGVAAAAEVTAP
jgi:arylsulfatase A-like enzyme